MRPMFHAMVAGHPLLSFLRRATVGVLRGGRIEQRSSQAGLLFNAPFSWDHAEEAASPR